MGKRQTILKRVIRWNMPETNSSSSHTVIIDFSKWNDNKFNNLQIEEDGYIRLNKSNIFFGGKWDMYNDPLTKLYYVCALACSGCKYETDTRKPLKYIEEIVKKFTGCKGIMFGWIKSYYDSLRLDDSPYPEIKTWPDIDHESIDITYEILESDETITNFIFNSNSWLFLGSDGKVKPEKWKVLGNTDEPEAILSVEFPGKIGRVDSPLQHYPTGNLRRELIDSNSLYEVLGNIVFNESSSSWEIINTGERFCLGENYYTLDIYREICDKFLVWNKVHSTELKKIPFTIISKKYGRIV